MVEYQKPLAEILIDELGVADYGSLPPLLDSSDVRSDVNMIYRLFELQKLVRFYRQRHWEQESLELALVPGRLGLENVAAHSFSVARCVTLLAPHFAWIDRARAIELALVHDEPEIVTGDKDPVGKDGQGSDTHAFNLARRLDKEREERRALDALTSTMRSSLRKSYRNLFEELIEGSSDEARLVKAVDKLQALAFVRLRKGARISPDHAAFTIRYSRIGVERFPPLQQHFMLILADLLQEIEHLKLGGLTAFCQEALSILRGADRR